MKVGQALSGTMPLVSVSIKQDVDVVAARQRAQQVAGQLGLSRPDQVRIATAVSEIARNTVQHGGGGRVEFSVDLRTDPQLLSVEISDRGAGAADWQTVLGGRRSPGVLSTTPRLVDRFDVQSTGEGTIIRLEKSLPHEKRWLARDVSAIAAQLSQQRTQDAYEEFREYDAELLEAFENLRAREAELARRETELARLNLELEETNRGVVALYAELDEKAVALRRADELKSRFLSHVSHEFRTPVNSILALTRLLLLRTDGDLTPEQAKQVGFIRQACQELAEMVNDLLDLAKVESGKTEVKITRIEIAQLFSALRGMMRPLVTNDAVSLVFEEPLAGITIDSDESKVNQILRNLLSNALKFTERGEVRVSCRESEDHVAITVSDTGIGIHQEDQERIFEEFRQVENRLQRKVKGTGLGLPLSRKLAVLLGGTLNVSSAPGEGSTFTLSLPASDKPVETAERRDPEQPGSDCILIIDDEERARYLVRQLFRGTRRPILEAAGGVEGAERARFERPALIILDLMMPDRNGFEVLDELKSDPATSGIPVVVHTSRHLGPADYERLAGRFAAVLPKGDDPQDPAFERIRAILGEPELFRASAN